MRTFTTDAFPETFDLIISMYANDADHVIEIIYDTWKRVYIDGRPLALDDISLQARAARYSNAYAYGDVLLILETFRGEVFKSYDIQEQYYYFSNDAFSIDNDFQDFLDDLGDDISTLLEYTNMNTVVGMLTNQYAVDYGRMLTEDQESELYSIVDDLATHNFVAYTY